jgi:hypothetical protein
MNKSTFVAVLLSLALVALTPAASFAEEASVEEDAPVATETHVPPADIPGPPASDPGGAGILASEFAVGALVVGGAFAVGLLAGGGLSTAIVSAGAVLIIYSLMP